MAFNYKKLGENLVVNDPIYGAITVTNPYSKIILTKEMRRLGDITQNGFSKYEFKGLENNDRLSHSVGAFYVMTLILERLEEVLLPYNITISDDDKDIALCSMLLHDIGHGPFSHSLEVVTNYSHEKRTTDILLGNTEVGNLLTKIYGSLKVKQIASFIAEINNDEKIIKDSFTKILKNLVSHQLDADRLDYLVRDAYYIGIKSAINLENIISNLNVVVNNNKEYELLINKRGLSSIENVLIQRYQMYRDVYLSPISVLGDEIFKQILSRFKKNKNLSNLPTSPYLKILAYDPQISNLEDFINMSDRDFNYSLKVLACNKKDNIMAYLCDYNNLDNYILLENNPSIETIKKYLKEIFGEINIDNTLSILRIKTKNKLYKNEERLNIQNGNRILNLTSCTNLIKPQEMLENTYTFFNPTLLKLELGLNDLEFREKYEKELEKMMEELNKKPEEFELKYIATQIEDKGELFKKIINLFLDNGFEIITTEEKQNDDEYYDTKDLSLYQKGGSLRIRKAISQNKFKYKGTYKMPLSEGEVYSSRTEIEVPLQDNEFSSFTNKMIISSAPIAFNEIVKKSILNSKTNRTDILIEKNGAQFSLSLDLSTYINHYLDNIEVKDCMIEIEAKGKINNRIMLNEIHDFMSKSMLDLKISKQSKYERGINMTLAAFNKKDVKQLTLKLKQCE